MATANRAESSAPRRRIYVRKAEPVLEAAERLFLSRGYGGTSMQDVAAAAGVAKATVYSNFPSKEALFSAVIHRRAERSRLDIDHVDLHSADVRSTLVELGCAFLHDIYSPGQVELLQTVVADARRFPQLGKLMIEGPFIETHGKISAYFSNIVGRGLLAHDDPETAAEYFIAIIKAGKHIPLILSQDVQTGPEAVRRTVEEAVDIFLRGLDPERSSSR